MGGIGVFSMLSLRPSGTAPARREGLLLHYCEVETQVQVPHLASVDPQREASCCCWTRGGKLGSNGVSTDTVLGMASLLLVIREVLTSLGLLWYHPSQEGKGTLFCHSSSAGKGGPCYWQHGREFRLPTWPSLTLPQQECWSIWLQPHEGGDLGSPLKFARLRVGGNILCFLWLD